MKPERYEKFYHLLHEKNLRLITSPEEYARFHLFANIYPALKNDTAEMLVFPEGHPVDLEAVRKKFSRFLVKDFVKSVKENSSRIFLKAPSHKRNLTST